MQKHCLLSIVLFLLAGSVAYGQIAVQAGYNSSTIVYELKEEYQDWEEVEGLEDEMNEGLTMIPGFHVGAIVEFPVIDFLSLQTGFIFNSKGHKKTWDDEPDFKQIFTKTTYHLDLPIVLTGVIPIGDQIEVRPSVGGYGSMAMFGQSHGEITHLDETLENNNALPWPRLADERFELGLTFGASVKWLDFELGGAYDLGLTEFSDEEEASIREFWTVNQRLWKVFGRYWF